MNIYDFALQMEKDGENFYRNLSKSCENIGIKKILSMLADDEAMHYKAILNMKNNQSSNILNSQIIQSSINIFKKIQNEINDSNLINISQIEMYENAKKIEKDSIDFYEQKGKEELIEPLKEIFLNLAKEEKKHLYLIENILEFVKRPEWWVENAEFSQLNEY